MSSTGRGMPTGFSLRFIMGDWWRTISLAARPSLQRFARTTWQDIDKDHVPSAVNQNAADVVQRA